MTTAERKAVDAVFVAMDTLAKINDKIIISYTQLDDVRVKTITAQALIIDRLLTQLNKKPSFWSKLWDAVQKALTLALGILIGRGL